MSGIGETNSKYSMDVPDDLYLKEIDYHVRFKIYSRFIQFDLLSLNNRASNLRNI